jgi:hypothetical protein
MRERTSLSSLTEGEPRSDLKSNVVHELSTHGDVVSGHDHLLVHVLRPFRERKSDSDVGGTDEHLRSVVVHERGVTSSLLLGEDVERGDELARGLDGSGEGEDHSTLDLLALDSSEEGSHVVSSLSAVQLLVKHLDTCETSEYSIREKERDTHQ